MRCFIHSTRNAIQYCMLWPLYRCHHPVVAVAAPGGGGPGERSRPSPPKPGKIPKGWDQLSQQPAHFKNFPKNFQICLYFSKNFIKNFKFFLKFFQFSLNFLKFFKMFWTVSQNIAGLYPEKGRSIANPHRPGLAFHADYSNF